ncbi:MAG: hypothetical protein ACREN4_06725 [Candidatus Dormibacteria bacterium]
MLDCNQLIGFHTLHIKEQVMFGAVMALLVQEHNRELRASATRSRRGARRRDEGQGESLPHTPRA